MSGVPFHCVGKVQSKTLPIKPVKRLTDVFNSKFGEIKPGGGAVCLLLRCGHCNGKYYIRAIAILKRAKRRCVFIYWLKLLCGVWERKTLRAMLMSACYGKLDAGLLGMLSDLVQNIAHCSTFSVTIVSPFQFL